MLGFHPLSTLPLSTLTMPVVLVGAAGAYAVTGQSAAQQLTIQHGAGAYALTGFDARQQLVIGHGLGAYAVTGFDAAQALTIRHGAGAYTVTGQDALLPRFLGAQAGAYTLTGFPIRWLRGPVYRARGRDFSGSYYAIRDTSEGLP